MKEPTDSTQQSSAQAQATAEPRTGILTRTTFEDTGLVRLPTLTPHLRFHNISDQQTLLVSESFNTLLGGQLTTNLLPLLDGESSTTDLVQVLSSRFTAADVHSALVSLVNKGYVVSGEHSLDNANAAYWSSQGASPRWVEQRLADCTVSVMEDGDQLSQQLRESGLQVVSQDPTLTVVVCDDYLEERLNHVNEQQLNLGTPWLLARPHGIHPLFGPIFHSDRAGPCLTCLTYRMRNHQEVHSFLRNVAGDSAAFKPFATNPIVLQALYQLIAAEILKWVVFQQSAALHEYAITIDVGTLSTTQHAVQRRPQCFVCGEDSLNRADRAPTPLVLKSSPKTHSNSGGDRTVAPEVTLAKYRHLISPISGVVTWLTRTTDVTDSWLHVYWAGSNLATRTRTLSSLRRSLRSKSAGKGSTRDQSEVSALCEAVERYSGVFHGDEIRRRRRFSDFCESDEAIQPNEVQLFSDAQLENAEQINAKGHPYNIVPKPFDLDALIDWTPVWSLTQQRHRYLPTSMLYSISAEQRSSTDLIADSNGCAAGNTLEEAILQGFLELVERDAFAIWWYNQLRVPQVDLSSFDDEFLGSAVSYYAKYGRELWLLDITSDFEIPTFVALSRRLDGQTEDIIYGAGAHVHSHIAAQRAICELNQCLTWLPRPNSRDGRPMIDDPLALWWWRTARLENCLWLTPADTKSRLATDFPTAVSEDCKEDVDRCRTMVESKGLDFLVLDQTRPDIGMPVVRVIVPGLRHFWARFAPGRLFDVPVDFGSLEVPLKEHQLNSAPVIA